MSFESRTGSFEFLVQNKKKWSDVYSELLAFMQGRFMRIVLEDDPLYYYEGRLHISSWKSNKNNSTITIDYDLSPFMYETENAVNGYLISERNLSGNVYYYADESTKVLEMIAECENITGSGIKAYIDGSSYQCHEGINLLPTLQCDGSGSIRLNGTGKITVKYRKGRL